MNPDQMSRFCIRFNVLMYTLMYFKALIKWIRDSIAGVIGKEQCSLGLVKGVQLRHLLWDRSVRSNL